MKIALVSPYDLAVPGGVNSHIHHLAEHFVARGHEVRLIAPASDVRNLSPLAIVVGRPRSIPAGGSIAPDATFRWSATFTSTATSCLRRTLTAPRRSTSTASIPATSAAAASVIRNSPR